MSDQDGFDQNTLSGRVRLWALTAIVAHRTAGTIPTSLRHLFYEAVMDARFADVTKDGRYLINGEGDRVKVKRRADQDLTDALTWLRENFYVGWDEIDDRTRHMIYNKGWDTVKTGALAHLANVQLDPYKGHVLPILVVESESVAGVLERPVGPYRVPIIPTRGQANGFLRTAVPSFIGDRQVVVGYIGDADKAGDDIENNTEMVLRDVLDIKSWQRLALTWGQVDHLGLPIEQRHDKRSRKHYDACEVEAFPQDMLEAEVIAFLDSYLPLPLNGVKAREKRQRAAIKKLLS